MVTKREIINYLSKFNDDDHITLEVTNYINAKTRCPGSDRDMGYWCCLEKGHKGRCYSSTKNLDFDSVSYGVARYDLTNSVGELIAPKGEPVEKTSPTRIYCRNAGKYFYIGRENMNDYIEWDQ